MKLIRCILVLFSINSFSSAYNPRILDYALQIIEHLASRRGGIFECVFFDMSPQYPFETIMTKLLASPRLQYVAKYVVQGSYRPETLPKKPLLVVMFPGPSDELKLEETQHTILKFLKLFHQSTEMVVLLDVKSTVYLAVMRKLQLKAKCYKMLFLDPNRYELRLGSLKSFNGHNGPVFPHPRHIYEWFQNELHGNTISYKTVLNHTIYPPLQWYLATVNYLGGKAVENKDRPDIILRKTIAKNVVDDFGRIFLKEPNVASILVPRGRPLNTFEIMLLPFDWPVWTLLAVILILAEIVKRLVPDSIRNDPILLVICGFERSNLHQAGRCEKMILHSLIILVFFMTNAFETKFISFLIDAPSAETAKTLEDFDKFGLSFRYNLDKEPYAAKHPVIGKYVVHDAIFHEVEHNEPGAAMYAGQDIVALLSELSYDFERGKSWFVELDQKFMVYPVQIYYTAVRCQYLETFRFTHIALREAGIMDWWQWRFGQYEVRRRLGLRQRGVDDGKMFLVFDDMLLAWIVLAIGSGSGTIGFISELVMNRIKLRIERKKFK